MCGIFQVTTDCFIVNQTVNVIEKEKVAIAKPETTDAEKKRIAEIERKEEEIRSFRAFYEKNEKRKRLILLKTLGILFSATGAVSCFFAVIFAFTAFSRTTGIEVIHTASYATKELDIFLMIVTVACVFAAVCFFRKYKKVKNQKEGECKIGVKPQKRRKCPAWRSMPGAGGEGVTFSKRRTVRPFSHTARSCSGADGSPWGRARLSARLPESAFHSGSLPRPWNGMR